MSTETVPISASTELAIERTRLAHDRTLMAWVRTATSLISFGFTIYKFFQYMQEKNQAGEGGLFSARRFAIFMIAIGLIALAIATYQHRQDMKALRRQFPHVPYSLATVLAAIISVFGLAALLAAVFRQ